MVCLEYPRHDEERPTGEMKVLPKLDRMEFQEFHGIIWKSFYSWQCLEMGDQRSSQSGSFVSGFGSLL